MLVRLDHKICCSYKEFLVARPVNIQLHKLLGDFSERDPPVPIPNTEVKPLSPDCTARASVWESRKLPGLKQKASDFFGGFFVSVLDSDAT